MGTANHDKRNTEYEEVVLQARSGMGILLLNVLLILVSVAVIVLGAILLAEEKAAIAGVICIVGGILYLCLVCPFLFAGLKVLKPNEALVLTLFGKYYGTLKGEGYFFVNPFVQGVNPASAASGNAGGPEIQPVITSAQSAQLQWNAAFGSKKLSLKAMTLDNGRQKINDVLGNPIEIGIVVIWRIVNTAKAVFNVDNYAEYLSVQCDSALRNIVRLYPYDVSSADDEKSLRGSSQEVADKLKIEIQSKMELAGIEILEARITHLAYAPEIAAAMLQRQQAAAIIDARKMIVDGAVGMVEMALEKLNENDIVHLDEDRKAAMVSNLLVVLCGNKDAQPIVNSGSIY